MKRVILLAMMVFLIFSCSKRKVTQPPEAGVKPGEAETEIVKPEVEQPQPTVEEGAAGLEGEQVIEEEIGIKEEKKPPEEEKAPSEALITEEEKAALFKDIYFDFNSYEIKSNDREHLKKIADWMISNPNTKLIIEGHCDERGTNEYNLGLGDKRANAVKEYLMSLGVAPNRLETVSYGEERPVCTEHTEQCWQKNRRAHFVLIEER